MCLKQSESCHITFCNDFSILNFIKIHQILLDVKWVHIDTDFLLIVCLYRLFCDIMARLQECILRVMYSKIVQYAIVYFDSVFKLHTSFK